MFPNEPAELKNKRQTLKVKYIEGIYYKVYYGHAVPGILELCVLAQTMHSKPRIEFEKIAFMYTSTTEYCSYYNAEIASSFCV